MTFSNLSLILFVIEIFKFSIIGVAISKILFDMDNETSITSAFGIALAPFLFGISSVLAMSVIPIEYQLYTLLTGSSALAVVSLALLLKNRPVRFRNSYMFGNYFLILLIAFWLAVFVFYIVTIPLIGNDALEYITVGRELYQSGAISRYPLIDTKLSNSGFFGPWTHPPLFVASIHFTNLIQGSADNIGLARFIPAWFFITSVILLSAMSKQANEHNGPYGAIIMLTIPLLFIGATQGSIDALAVAGLTLVLATVITTKVAPRRSVAIGIALGLALWTHSQAILLIPLLLAINTIYWGLKNSGKYIKETGIILSVGLIIAIWPYLKNYVLYGSPVSDTPLIFSLPILEWDEYFSAARGLDTTISTIQYGVLRGWFNISNFGLIFWFALFGFILVIQKIFKSGVMQLIVNGVSNEPVATKILVISSGLFILYIAAMALSAALGINVMIRNPRYLLIITPPACILSGYFILRLSVYVVSYIKNYRNSGLFREVYYVAFSIGLSITLIIYLVYTKVPNQLYSTALYFNSKLQNNFSVPDISLHDWLQRKHSYINVTEWIAKHVPAEKLIFSMRPSTMYFANQKMISYLDPKMVDFYNAKSSDEAYEILTSAGITYIQLTDYYFPVVYNSYLQQILADQRKSSLIYEHFGNQVYQLRTAKRRDVDSIDISPGTIKWEKREFYTFAGNKLDKVFSKPNPVFENGSPSISTAPYGLFELDYVRSLEPMLDWKSLPITPGKEFQINFDFIGIGYFSINLTVETPDYSYSYVIGDFVLTKTKIRQKLLRRLKLIPDATNLSISIKQYGTSSLKINSMTLDGFR